jgi:hypothetical protein
VYKGKNDRSAVGNLIFGIRHDVDGSNDDDWSSGLQVGMPIATLLTFSIAT